jgi:hypothetical protein
MPSTAVKLRRGAADLAAEHREAAIQRLAGILTDDTASDKDAIAAAKEILNRSDGTPSPAAPPVLPNKQKIIDMEKVSDQELEAYALTAAPPDISEQPFQRVSDMPIIDAELDDPASDPLLQ